MNEQHSYRANIPPVAEDVVRPLWSVMIPTYNCAKYLRETLAGVLAQDPGPDTMQIEVIDDCSTKDDPAAVVEELGCGRVKFYRQPHNVGHTKNFETCLNRARGKLIHQLHGDDCVRDGFYGQMQKAFEEKPEIGAAFCRHIFMDENSHWQYLSELEQAESGILDNWLERIATFQRIQTPSVIVRREVYEKLGGFDNRLSWSEDWEMWVRIAAHYPIWYEVQPLAIYRKHSISSTGRHIRTGENIRDARRCIEIIHSYLPKELAGKLSVQAKINWAFNALNSDAPALLRIGDFNAAATQIQEALKCSNSFNIVLPALKLSTKILYKKLRTKSAVNVCDS
jgi:glycosyltransferase involved in cell wall biosynthesis